MTSPEKARPEHKAPTKKPLIRKLLGNLLFRLALSGGVVGGGAGYAAYQEIPAVHQTIDQAGKDIINSRNGFITPEKPVPVPPEVFDKRALAGTISEKNTIVMPKEQAKQLFPQPIELNEETRTATIFNFLEPPKGETITWNRIPIVNSETGILMHAWQATLPAGTKIKVSPVADEYVTTDAGVKYEGKGGNDKSKADLIYKFSYSPTVDMTTVVTIGSVTGWFIVLPEMQNLPTYASIDILKKLPQNTVIATTNQPTQVDISVKTIRGKSMATVESLNGRVIYSPNFFSIPSSGDDSDKIVDVK